MEERSRFFEKSGVAAALVKFRNRIEHLSAADEFEVARNSHIKFVVNSMASRPDEWDQWCQINIGWIGESFVHQISDEAIELNKENVDDIFSMCFRFLFELYLSIKTDLAMDLERARKFALTHLDRLEPHAREQIEYAIRDMPISIFKAVANSDAIGSLKKFNDLSEQADKKRLAWDEDLSAREQRVSALRAELESYESGFNFVGLFDGFNDLSKEKKEEKNVLRTWLVVVGFLIVAPLFAELGFLYVHADDIEEITKSALALSIVPTVSLVAILIYYFRVILFNYGSAKSQLLQIELRKTLCRFIQHYTEYSHGMKQKDKSSLEKFENVIFSGIVSDDGALPSTYDGVEQLGKLVKAIKG